MAGTDIAERPTFDLTRSPSEQWNQEMLDVVTRNVFRGTEITEKQLYYCLSVAESLSLNPMIEEIYFLPTKSKDAKGPAFKPYIGRNGLVAKAQERDAYYESDTVRENDRFRMTRKGSGDDAEVTITHSFGVKDRGEVIGAYAFLHFRNGDKPAFFWAPLVDYLPTFDAEWKAERSPWYNQRSAMIEKCAMIGAGRKRLRLGNLLADGEIERVMQQQQVGPAGQPRDADPVADAEFDWSSLKGSPKLVDRLRAAVFATNDLHPLTWTPARLQMVLSGMSDVELLEQTKLIENALPHDEPAEEVTDAVVVPELTPEQQERVIVLQNRIADLQIQHQAAETDADHELLDEEIAMVGAELAAIGDADQSSLL